MKADEQQIKSIYSLFAEMKKNESRTKARRTRAEPVRVLGDRFRRATKFKLKWKASGGSRKAPKPWDSATRDGRSCGADLFSPDLVACGWDASKNTRFKNVIVANFVF